MHNSFEGSELHILMEFAYLSISKQNDKAVQSIFYSRLSTQFAKDVFLDLANKKQTTASDFIRRINQNLGYQNV